MELRLCIEMGTRGNRSCFEGRICVDDGIVIGILKSKAKSKSVSGKDENGSLSIEIWPICGAYAKDTAFTLVRYDTGWALRQQSIQHGWLPVSLVSCEEIKEENRGGT